LRVKPIFRQHRDMLVTEDLDVCARICMAQRLQHGQREDEIANRTAADHKNPVHSILCFVRRSWSAATEDLNKP